METQRNLESATWKAPKGAGDKHEASPLDRIFEIKKGITSERSGLDRAAKHLSEALTDIARLNVLIQIAEMLAASPELRSPVDMQVVEDDIDEDLEVEVDDGPSKGKGKSKSKPTPKSGKDDEDDADPKARKKKKDDEDADEKAPKKRNDKLNANKRKASPLQIC